MYSKQLKIKTLSCARTVGLKVEKENNKTKILKGFVIGKNMLRLDMIYLRPTIRNTNSKYTMHFLKYLRLSMFIFKVLERDSIVTVL